LNGVPGKDLKGMADAFKKKLGSGVVALIGVEEGKASAVVGVTDDLAKSLSAVDLVKAGVAALGGNGRIGGIRKLGAQAKSSVSGWKVPVRLFGLRIAGDSPNVRRKSRVPAGTKIGGVPIMIIEIVFKRLPQLIQVRFPFQIMGSCRLPP